MAEPPRSLVEEWEDKLDVTARGIASGARKLVLTLLLLGWSGFWAVLTLIGWIFSLPALLTTGGAVLSATFVGVLVTRAVRRRRLAERAESELIARAELDRLALDRPLGAILGDFDVSYRRARQMLETSEMIDEGLAVEAGVDLERVREHLYDVARRSAATRADLRSLERARSKSDTVAELRRELAERHAEAEQIAKDCFQLSKRLTEIRAMGVGQNDASTGRALEQVIQELDRTSAAYREIEAAETEVQRRVRQARALRNVS